MKLRGWHIAGFGSLVDWRQDDLSNGLNVFYGPNEAGKSTLLAFLRFALFGFRPGNTKDLKYPPAPGIRHGGSVFLDEHAEASAADGSFVIERIANAGRGAKKLRIENAKGEESPEAELVRLLGHADRELFNNVFAFSLTELQSLESLTEKGVQDHIFSAGITGAGRSARDALEQIRKEADELFKGKAKTRVSLLVEEISRVDEALRVGRERARGYPELAERERELDARVVTARTAIDDHRRAGQRARKLGELWREVYGPMLENQQQLDGLVAIEGFGPDARGKLEALTSSLERAGEQAANTGREAQSLAKSLEKLAPDTSALGVREEVGALERDLGLYESQCKAVPVSEGQVAAQETGLRDALANLGPEWDEARLSEIHVSLSIASEATRFEERLGGARNRTREFENRLREGKQRLAELTDALEEEASIGAPSDHLEQRAAGLRALRSELSKRIKLEARVEATRGVGTGNGSAGTTRLQRLCVGAAIIGALAAAVLFANNGFELSTEPMLIVALMTLLFGALGGFVLRSSDADVRTSDKNLDSLEEELASFDRKLQIETQELQLAAAPDVDDVEAAIIALERVRTARSGLESELKRTQSSIDGLERSSSIASDELETVRNEWEQWAADAGLPPSLAPRDVGLFAGEVKAARDHLAARDAAKNELAGLFDGIGNWEQRALRALAESGEVVPESASDSGSEPSLIPPFMKLARRVREADERERQRPEIESADADARTRTAEAEQAVVAAREAVEELFGQVEAGGREDYLAKLDVFERKTQLEAKVRDQAGELSRRLGLGEEAAALRAELETGRVGEWEAQATSAESEAANLQAQSDDLVRTHRDVENEIEDLHGSNDLGSLELSRSTLQQELSECVSRWRELQVARGLIERTLERFERERQPAVLQEASHHFSKVTGGRYPKIVQTAELGSFSVVDAGGERKTPSELSRGTAEQLYVCIRLGLIAEFCRRAGQLPVAMDDVLVNFDDDRALAMAHVLADFSQRNACQVLVFTCSSRTRELFQQAAPQAQHVEFARPSMPASQ